jgi:ethanolamine-phosphate cytidylyltransferase
VAACKWVDEVVRDVPYVLDADYLDKVVFGQHNIDYVVHGDDPCLLPDGTDVFATAKKAGRFRTIKRTEGVSTTEIVGRMLMLTKEHFRRTSDADIEKTSDFKSHHQRSTSFLATGRRIVQFASGKSPKPTDKVVYIDGAWDLFHEGHISILEDAAKLGNFLIVGVHADDVVNALRGYNFPIMNLHERVLSVLSCKYVDEVIIGAPWKLTKDMIKSMNISVVAHGQVSDSDWHRYKPDEDPYQVGRELGILHGIKSRSKLTTRDIVERILKRRTEFQVKHKKKSEKEEAYLAEKKFVQEL